MCSSGDCVVSQFYPVHLCTLNLTDEERELDWAVVLIWYELPSHYYLAWSLEYYGHAVARGQGSC